MRHTQNNELPEAKDPCHDHSLNHWNPDDGDCDQHPHKQATHDQLLPVRNFACAVPSAAVPHPLPHQRPHVHSEDGGGRVEDGGEGGHESCHHHRQHEAGET